MLYDLKKIYDTRIDNDLSQKDIALILNVTQNVYNNYETYRTTFPVKQIVVFANYFNLSLDYLFGLSNSKRKFYCSTVFNEKLVAERIFLIRKRCQLSQAKFGKKINLPQRTYASYESNERTIPMEVLFNIAVLSNVSLDYLTGRTNNSKI